MHKRSKKSDRPKDSYFEPEIADSNEPRQDLNLNSKQMDELCYGLVKTKLPANVKSFEDVIDWLDKTLLHVDSVELETNKEFYLDLVGIPGNAIKILMEKRYEEHNTYGLAWYYVIQFGKDKSNIFETIKKRDQIYEIKCQIQHESDPFLHQEQIFKFVYLSSSRFQLDRILELTDIQAVDGKTLLFHATNANFATSILEKGPNEESKATREASDFGPGFYLTDNFNYALRLSKSLPSTVSVSEKAILIFQVPNQFFDNFVTIDSSINLETWQRFVKLCQKGNPPLRYLGNYKGVKGNPTSNPADSRRCQIPRPQSGLNQFSIYDIAKVQLLPTYCVGVIIFDV